jgi:tRNA pseudouridine38-40 synthase
LRKIRLLIEYDGKAYHGWQLQSKGDTLQGVIEDRIIKLTGEHSRIVGASRTDAGVHALGQIATFRTGSDLDATTIKKALNALLPRDIRVLDASEVDDSFHPRKDAVEKSYFYIISNQRKSSVFLYRYSWLVVQQLDMKAMKEAAEVLIGNHDFSSFMGAGSDIQSPVREILSLSIERLESIDFMTIALNGNFIKIRVAANGFLRHMVRNIVGTLTEIGRGRIPSAGMEDILNSHDRKRAGRTAPPNGLFLERIVY